MATSITVTDLIVKVQEIANEKPGVFYCDSVGYAKYNGPASDGSIGCLFGQAFRALGIDINKLRKVSIYDANQTCIVGLINVGNFGWNYSHSERDWCDIVQRWQDNGIDWATCVKRANRLYPCHAIQLVQDESK